MGPEQIRELLQSNNKMTITLIKNMDKEFEEITLEKKKDLQMKNKHIHRQSTSSVSRKQKFNHSKILIDNGKAVVKLKRLTILNVSLIDSGNEKYYIYFEKHFGIFL